MDLTKTENRKKYILDCEKNLIEDLRKHGLLISDKAVVEIKKYTILIGVNYQNREGFDFDFASKVRIHIDETIRLAMEGCGSFNPSDINNNAQYWRIIHGGEILKNWERVVPIFKLYHQMVNKLYDIPVVD